MTTDTSLDPPSKRTRRRTSLTALVLAVVMLVWGYAELTRPFHAGSSACGNSAGTVKRSTVTVSVYNAGAPNGSAAKLAASLRDLGFKVATVANAPTGLTIGAVNVVGVSSTDPAAQLVAAAFGAQVSDDSSLLVGPGVNVYIGTQPVTIVKRAPTQITPEDSSC